MFSYIRLSSFESDRQIPVPNRYSNHSPDARGIDAIARLPPPYFSASVHSKEVADAASPMYSNDAVELLSVRT